MHHLTEKQYHEHLWREQVKREGPVRTEVKNGTTFYYYAPLVNPPPQPEPPPHAPTVPRVDMFTKNAFDQRNMQNELAMVFEAMPEGYFAQGFEGITHAKEAEFRENLVKARFKEYNHKYKKVVK